MISFINVKYDHGYKEKVLNDVSLEIKKGEIVAIVGANGAGKSTLLKLINDRIKPDDGIVAISQDMKTMEMLEQIPQKLDDNVTVEDILMPEIYKIQQELEEITLKYSIPNIDYDKVDREYQRVLEKLENASNDNNLQKLAKTRQKFSITDEMLERKYNSLSGGEKTRVWLCTIMSEDPEVLLLDEPTNHLDFEALKELENFVKECSKTVIFVSHDRYFIDRVAQKTILLERGKVFITNGNYSEFLEKNEIRKEKELKDYEIQHDEIQKMTEAAKKLRNFGRIGDNESFFKRAKSIENRIEKMDKIEKPKEAIKTKLDFEIRDRSGKDVIRVKDLKIEFENNKTIFEELSMDIHYGEHVCIIGSNGAGKSTLIRSIISTYENNEILGKIKGDITIAESATIGYIPQEIHFENESQRVIEYFREFITGDETRLRSTLIRYGFRQDSIEKPVGKLSGGEKVRILLARLIYKKANVLIFDEPTNHIDTETRDSLEKALLDYAGTIIFVSHDRFFINRIADTVFELKNGKIKKYSGNFDIYQSIKEFENKQQEEKEKKSANIKKKK